MNGRLWTHPCNQGVDSCRMIFGVRKIFLKKSGDIHLHLAALNRLTLKKTGYVRAKCTAFSSADS